MQLGGTAHRVDDAREFRQQAVAGVLYDAATVLRDLRIDQFAQMRPQAFVGAFLIGAHQARIACHIGGEDRGETPRGADDRRIAHYPALVGAVDK